MDFAKNANYKKRPQLKNDKDKAVVLIYISNVDYLQVNIKNRYYINNLLLTYPFQHLLVIISADH
jgi:hypothetical protein